MRSYGKQQVAEGKKRQHVTKCKKKVAKSEKIKMWQNEKVTKCTQPQRTTKGEKGDKRTKCNEMQQLTTAHD